MWQVRRNACSQFCHTILAIPGFKRVQPGVHGVELLNARRLDETGDVPVPRLESHLLRPHGHFVTGLIVQIAEFLILTVVLTILRHTGHHILTHLIVRMQKDVRLHHQYRVLWHTLQRSDLVTFLPSLHVRHSIGVGKSHLHQQFIGIEHRMQHGQPLGMSFGDALIQTHRSNLHQQGGLLVLVGQLKIMPHYLLHYEGPVQMIGSGGGSSWHQMVFSSAYCNGLGVFMTLGVGIERSGIGVESCLRVSTHIDRSVQAGLQEFYVEVELVLIGSASCIIYIKVELTDFIFFLGQTASVQFAPTDNLYAPS